MSKIITIDVGGTSIKSALWDSSDQTLSNKNKASTPKTLSEFYQVMENIVAQFAGEKVAGVAIAIPGAVNQDTGIIGGISAIPYIHNFEIRRELSKRFNLPVEMENDANSAALAEIDSGAAKDMQNVIFFIIGTGVGGSVVLNRQVVHGSHLFAGDFGMTVSHHNKRLVTWELQCIWPIYITNSIIKI